MARRVVISGLGPIGPLGAGIEPTWERLVAGQGAVAPIRSFDPAGFDCRIAAELAEFSIRDYVPKSYRKATKVMARDIELAVAGADLAARDAGLVTHGTAGDDQPPTYAPTRVGAHIGAGLIAAQLDELTAALAEATDEQGTFDYHRWGREGITHLTPLWLLKYLPNMLACHVTIIHDAQGPSNTITCGEASSVLSIGESLRVIQRGAADLCFCGGAESKFNPMTYLRQLMTGRLNVTDNENPATAVRPFCHTAAGTVVGEGGGIVILEQLDTYKKRASADQGNSQQKPYAEVIGFGASQTVNRASRNLEPDAHGKGIATAIGSALREAEIDANAIDLIVPFGAAIPAYDQAEAAALRQVFGDRIKDVPVASIKSMAGNCGAGAGGLDVYVAAQAIAQQTIPAVINCEQPLEGLAAGSSPSRPAQIDHALVYSTGLGGQNAALVLKKIND
jgi:3-oxoacyl-[acyl-carrier-protein] synthase II